MSTKNWLVFFALYLRTVTHCIYLFSSTSWEGVFLEMFGFWWILVIWWWILTVQGTLGDEGWPFATNGLISSLRRGWETEPRSWWIFFSWRKEQLGKSRLVWKHKTAAFFCMIPAHSGNLKWEFCNVSSHIWWYFLLGVLQFTNRQADEDETRPLFSTIVNASMFCPPKNGGRASMRWSSEDDSNLLFFCSDLTSNESPQVVASSLTFSSTSLEFSYQRVDGPLQADNLIAAFS